jgi:GNAT superfamily N-acetyltransferase
VAEELAYQIIDVNETNIDKHDILCLKSKKKTDGYKNKVKWLKERFKEGLHLRLLLVNEGPRRGFTSRGFIEYIPGEYSWRGINAEGYMVIHCIWVVGRNQKHGYGRMLLQHCFNDAKGMNGVAIVTSERPWLAKKAFFLRNGFELVQKAPPSFELLVKQFKDAPLPRFSNQWQERAAQYGSGLAVLYSDQCPYIHERVRYVSATAEKHGIPLKLVKLDNCTQAQSAPAPYGVYSVLYNGKFISHKPGIPTQLLKQILEERK